MSLLKKVESELYLWDRRFGSARDTAEDVLEICAHEIESIPTGASLYESNEIAKAVSDFKGRVVEILRSHD